MRLNTIGFLQNCPQLEKYSVSPKRGIILAGELGTRKTMSVRHYRKLPWSWLSIKVLDDIFLVLIIENFRKNSAFAHYL
jgi:hypothetical protein